MFMTVLGSSRVLCFAVLLATVPLFAEEPAASAPPHAIAEGTRFMVRLEDKLDVSRVRPGKRFKAKLMDDVMGPDERMLVHGSTIKGHVSQVGNGFHPRLLLSFDEIETQRGWTPLMATVIDVPSEHGLKTGEEGAIERQGQGGEHQNPDSDGVSAKAGAAAGVLRTIFSDHTLRLEKGTILDIRLDRPVQLRWR
jgi:hypothetical protein